MLMNIPQRNSTEGSLLANNRFLRQVAYMYYEESRTQEEIAATLYCSRQTVGKALQRAKDLKIVHISVVPEERTGYLRNLSRDLRLTLKLDDLVLVAGRSTTSRDPHKVLDDVVADITSTAAEYLDQLITNDDILAVSGGRTLMRNVVRYLKPGKLLPGLKVIPTIGFVEAHTTIGDSNLITYDIAAAYGAQYAWFPIPAIVETIEQREQARALPLIRDVFKEMEKATIIMMGLWSWHANHDLIKRGVLSQHHIKALQIHEPVADINHWVFDASGRCINEVLQTPPYYLTGLEIPHLRERIRQERIKVILVAGGSPSYIPAIQAALKAGIANILITDHVTAELLRDHSTEK